MKIAIDAMGGDNAPSIPIEGTVLASNQLPYEFILIGNEKIVEKELQNYTFNQNKISIYHTSEVIGMDESPSYACRQKKDSSIIRGCQLVNERKVDAFVSAGNSGAVMAAALIHLGRISGVTRPAIALSFPTPKGISLLLDVGANVDCKPRHLLEFAVMGQIYAKEIFKISNPTVGLLSIGKEESKGNSLTLETYSLLRDKSSNFIGNIEGGDIPKGVADVVVCDGFVGNVLIKTAEGIYEVAQEWIKREILKNPVNKFFAFFLKGAMKNIKGNLNYEEYGGAPLLGVNGACIISHGHSNAKAISNAIKVGVRFIEQNVNHHIENKLKEILLNKGEEIDSDY